MRAFLWQYENSTLENGFVNVIPQDAADDACVGSSPLKVKR
ncbi:hypothetical protein SPC_0870 [Salmonella enterica subsp. enterica serovar Paratyphi C str. RKS4594]|uniref:Uncharacterized protein n=1 Tax=Salmonella paratyphi C (strain RKS4594) TaxID=476213 RepID=C0PX58_SALPC|nr:hypothetical protein SPC_0870 [Salmonella enterica subsp. enterica serovar Paratyphi C str. RKS4594]